MANNSYWLNSMGLPDYIYTLTDKATGTPEYYEAINELAEQSGYEPPFSASDIALAKFYATLSDRERDIAYISQYLPRAIVLRDMGLEDDERVRSVRVKLCQLGIGDLL